MGISHRNGWLKGYDVTTKVAGWLTKRSDRRGSYLETGTFRATLGLFLSVIKTKPFVSGPTWNSGSNLAGQVISCFYETRVIITLLMYTRPQNFLDQSSLVKYGF
jgi:hypothetical protein